MKNALKNFLLWQKKRNELQVNDDPQADWGQMQWLLDEHMPVVKKPGGFIRFLDLENRATKAGRAIPGSTVAHRCG